jgi:hypothetical protein
MRTKRGTLGLAGVAIVVISVVAYQHFQASPTAELLSKGATVAIHDVKVNVTMIVSVR